MGTNRSRSTNRSEAGMAIAALLIMLVPLLAVAGAAVSVMKVRTQVTVAETANERALLAAESGIDTMLHQANTATLVPDVPLSVKVGPDTNFVAVATDLETDGLDNDGDGDIDELDESIYEVTVAGEYRNTRRRVVCYLRLIVDFPPIQSAVHSNAFPAAVSASGKSFSVDGNPVDIAGAPVAGTAKPGISIAPPNDPATYAGGLTPIQQARVTGAGPAPSIGVATETIDPAQLINDLKSYAHTMLPGGTYSSIADFGSAPSTWRITYFAGDTTLTGTIEGAGILLCDGNLHLSGDVDYIGLVIARGGVHLLGGGKGTMIRGGTIAGGDLEMSGTVDLQYSPVALKTMRDAMFKKRTVYGWRQIAQN